MSAHGVDTSANRKTDGTPGCPLCSAAPPKPCRGAAPSIAAPCCILAVHCNTSRGVGGGEGRSLGRLQWGGRVGNPAVGSPLPAALSARNRQQHDADIPTKWGSAQMNAFDPIQLTPKLNSDAWANPPPHSPPIPNPPTLPDPEFSLGSIRFTTPKAACSAAPPRGETEAGSKRWERQKFPPGGFRSFGSQKEGGNRGIFPLICLSRRSNFAPISKSVLIPSSEQQWSRD